MAAGSQGHEKDVDDENGEEGGAVGVETMVHETRKGGCG